MPTKRVKKKPSLLSTKIKKGLQARSKSKKPVWNGPEVDGITQSLLSRFLVCRERFKILTIDGLRPHPEFSHRLEYGQMWHTCEEALAAGESWKGALTEYCTQLCIKYRAEQNQIDKWYNVCQKQFPIYVDYWAKHPDVKQRTPLLQEQVFRVPYKLPSGRTVILRGKWDSVDLIGKGQRAFIYLQENKTKADIDENSLQRQLRFDLQTMIYLIALKEYATQPDNEFVAGQQIKGVRYNVVRRPLSGGKGSIKQHKPTKSNPQGETKTEFYDRLQKYFIEEPEYWFMRWTVDISDEDIQRFKREFFDPCLEHLCLWYEYITTGRVEVMYERALHYRLPYGIYNPLLEGRGTDIEEYLLTGSTVGLERVESLFGELEEGVA